MPSPSPTSPLSTSGALPTDRFGSKFTLFSVARFLFIAGVQMHSVAVGWQIYAVTQRAWALGWVGLVQFLPLVLFSLPGGHAVDRYERRKVLATALLGHAACAGILLWTTAAGTFNVHWAYGALAVFGVARAFSAPASTAMLPGVVAREQLVRAITWNSTLRQVAVIVGPAVGGFLYAGGGPALVYAVAVACALLAGALTLALPASRSMAVREDLTLRSVFAGVKYVWRQKILLGSISLDLFAVLLGGAVALLPMFAQDILQVGPTGLGALRSAPAVGAGSCALFLAFRPLGGKAGMKLYWAVAIFGVATVVFGLSRDFYLSLLALVVLGAADMVSMVIRQNLEQLATPDSMRGRVSAVNQVFISASNELGEFESGVTAAWMGPVLATVVGGMGTLAVAALWLRLFPSIRQVDRLESVHALAEAG